MVGWIGVGGGDGADGGGATFIIGLVGCVGTPMPTFGGGIGVLPRLGPVPSDAPGIPGNESFVPGGIGGRAGRLAGG